MVETERLIIQPLTYEQVLSFLKLNNILETELGLNANQRSISVQLLHGIENYTIPWLKAHPGNYLYYTMWIVIDKFENAIVADLSFKGAPNKEGEIEIGYGAQPHCRNKGYMTEAVGGMIEWAKGQKAVKVILAETRSDNIPSIIILKKNNFVFLQQSGNMMWWQRDLEK